MTAAIKYVVSRVRLWALFVPFTLVLGPTSASAAEKLAICHLSPGNPENHQTIIVGASDVPAHLAHGDSLGACPSGCPPLDPSACDDSNPCTSDVCLSNGECSHTVVDCDDGNVCTQDVCFEDVGCKYLPVLDQCGTTSCDDGNACTTSDTCEDGICKGRLNPECQGCEIDADCTNKNACTENVCGAGNVCVFPEKICADPTDPCLTAMCDPATGECATAPVTCDDNNICTNDSCNPTVGCEYTETTNPPEPGTEISCNDGLDNDCDGLIDFADSDCPQCACPECMTTQPDAFMDAGCAIIQCDNGFANCDGIFANGCETNVTSDSNNCAACGNVCDSASICSNGACKPTSCSSDADCSAHETCASGTCFRQCTSDADCPSDFTCKMFIPNIILSICLPQ